MKQYYFKPATDRHMQSYSVITDSLAEGMVVDGGISNAADLYSNSIFQEQDRFKASSVFDPERSLIVSHEHKLRMQRAVIELNAKIINKTATGYEMDKNYLISYLSKAYQMEIAVGEDNLLDIHRFIPEGIDTLELSSIAKNFVNNIVETCKFNLIFNIYTKEFSPPKETDDSPYSNYLYGAEVVEYMIYGIKNMKALNQKLELKMINNCIGGFFTLTEDKTDFPIYGNYYLKPRQNEIATTVDEGTKNVPDWYKRANEDYRIRTKREYREVVDSLAEIVTSKEFSFKSVDTMLDCLTKRITVTAPILRQKIRGAHDPITKKYDKILRAAGDLKSSKNSSMSPAQVNEKYRDLDNAVVSLRKGTDVDKKAKNNQGKSLMSANSKKEGRIRHSLLGKRLDYSGRSVIIVNPDIDINHVKLPKKIIVGLFYYHAIKSKIKSGKHLDVDINDLYRSIERIPMEIKYQEIMESGVMQEVPVIINRAPTLHRLSMRAFFALETSSGNESAIELNPLVCPGYNADFDGDQVTVHVPMSDEAVEETRELLLSERNLFVPGSGDHTLLPRHEMLYGLNVLTQNYPSTGTVKDTYGISEMGRLKDEILTLETEVSDQVRVKLRSGEILEDTAGKVLFRHIVNDMDMKVEPVKPANIGDIATKILFDQGLKAYVKALQDMTQIGFEISTLYAPSVSILEDIDDEFLKNPFKKFHEAIDIPSKRYKDGLEEEATYDEIVNKEYSKVESEAKERLRKVLDSKDNGYLRLVDSGARGSFDNLVQIYLYKGRIQKSSSEAFRAIIERPFMSQLSPLEHFQSAYGSRTGMIDKVSKTADTGYLNRIAYQAASDVYIRSKDCGTTHGIYISISDIAEHRPNGTWDSNKKEFVKLLTGRYASEVNSRITSDIRDKLKKNDMYITQEIANELANLNVSISIRSPLMCKDQCCTKCYGKDLTIQGPVTVGFPAGFIAGQSIGEPGTQLVMRSFHKGGVAGKSTTATDFDRLKALMYNTMNKDKPGYDPIAGDDGITRVVRTLTTTEVEIITNDDSNETYYKDGSGLKFTLNSPTVEIKKEVKRGRGICTEGGDHSTNELIKYRGRLEARKYLALIMFATYLGKASVDFKHFEVLTSELFKFVCVKPAEGSGHVTGAEYSMHEVFDKAGCVYDPDIEDNVPASGVYSFITIKAKDTQLASPDPLNRILMEYFIDGLTKSTMLGLKSNLETQMGRMMMGKGVTVGTGGNPNYIEERRINERYIK